MDNLTGILTSGLATVESNSAKDLAGDKIEALKALAMLLLREIESVEKTMAGKVKRSRNENISLSDEVQQYEMELIRYALLRAHGHQRQAARMLGTKVTTLNAKLKRYNIDPINLGKSLEISS